MNHTDYGVERQALPLPGRWRRGRRWPAVRGRDAAPVSRPFIAFVEW